MQIEKYKNIISLEEKNFLKTKESYQQKYRHDIGARLFYRDIDRNILPDYFKKYVVKYRKKITTAKKARARFQSKLNLKNAILFLAGYKCQRCKSTQNLVFHHIIPVKIAPQKSTDPQNIAVVCVDCHKIIHKSKKPKSFHVKHRIKTQKIKL